LIAAVVLAAGASSRYGSSPPKQAVYLDRVLTALRESAVDEIVVATGAHALETDARIVHCAEWERGPGATLRCALEQIDADAAIVVLADGPDLDSRAVDRLIAVWNGDDVLAACYDGVRLHPVLLARAAWASVPDEGAKGLPAHLVACDDLTPPGDVDVSPAGS
jgi:CTP:molybdopterin cytidylyltransferase MocA